MNLSEHHVSLTLHGYRTRTISVQPLQSEHVELETGSADVTMNYTCGERKDRATIHVTHMATVHVQFEKNCQARISYR